MFRRLLAALTILFCLPAPSAWARTVRVTAGTTLYGELDERVTSRVKKDGTSVGDVVRGHVWRDVVVDGVVAIPAGSPMLLRVSSVKKSNMAGIKGKLEIGAVSVTLADGTEIPLSGGYDKSGHGRKALSITLAAVVAWPLIFIRGKQAVLEPGTVFDARVAETKTVEAEPGARRVVRLSDAPSLEAVVLYDVMDEDGKSKRLPLRLEACDGAVTAGARVVTVNERPIDEIPLDVTSRHAEGACETAEATVDLKPLGKHFTRGINRFEVQAGDLRSEILLDIEL